MVYECDQCSAALPAGVLACPRCGEQFDDAVPADALVPRGGFSAAEREAARQGEQAQAEADLALLRQQMVGLEDEVLTLRSHLVKLTEELTGSEGHSALLLSHQTTLENRVEQLEHQATLQTSQIVMLVQYASGLDGERRQCGGQVLGYRQVTFWRQAATSVLANQDCLCWPELCGTRERTG